MLIGCVKIDRKKEMNKKYSYPYTIDQPIGFLFLNGLYRIIDKIKKEKDLKKLDYKYIKEYFDFDLKKLEKKISIKQKLNLLKRICTFNKYIKINKNQNPYLKSIKYLIESKNIC